MPRSAVVPSARGHLLTTALRALVLLRQGRWTIPDLADALGLHVRTAYRLIHALRDAGVTVERSEEPGGEAHYRVPAGALRALLRL